MRTRILPGMFAAESTWPDRFSRRAAALAGALLLAAVQPLAAEEPEQAPPQPRQVQAAIEEGLKWLADKQVKGGSESGSWECASYHTATASLAGLAFLANGHLPDQGDYGAAVSRALKYVRAGTNPDGYLGGRYEAGMYVHAIATLFGLSCLGMSPQGQADKELAEWCRRSLAVILQAQKVPKRPWEMGGWRYTPYLAESDLSVTSWQLLVLHTAKQCGYDIDPAVIDAALRYVNSAYQTAPAGEAGFVYRPGVSKSPEPAVTGVAVFLKALLEEEPDEKARKSMEFLRRFPPSWGGSQYKGYFFFGTFYMAQGMFQAGDEAWGDFSPRIQRILIDRQQVDGSWPLPEDNKFESRQAGPAYPTAMAVLVLSLDKQYLPMYQRQKRLY